MKTPLRRSAMVAAAAAGLWAVSGIAVAQRQGSSANSAATRQEKSGGTISRSDQAFMRKAAQGNMAEAQLGKLAVQKASSDGVKKFGQTMVDDHGAALQEMKTFATDHKVNLPDSMDAKHQALEQKLSGLSGAAFDRAYITAMVAEHQKDVATWQAKANNAQSTDLRQWVAGKVPTLRHHLEMARSLRGEMKPSGTRQGAK